MSHLNSFEIQCLDFLHSMFFFIKLKKCIMFSERNTARWAVVEGWWAPSAYLKPVNLGTVCILHQLKLHKLCIGFHVFYHILWSWMSYLGLQMHQIWTINFVVYGWNGLRSRPVLNWSHLFRPLIAHLLLLPPSSTPELDNAICSMSAQDQS